MGYNETTNLKLKKPTPGTVKTEWPGYINGNFDAIDAEMANPHCNQITLGGVPRSTWPSPGSASQTMDDTYNNGSIVNVDNTDEVHQLTTGKKFKLTNADGSVTYMQAEGGKGITFPNGPMFQNQLVNSAFSIWSNATLENVGSNLLTGWTNSAMYVYETFTASGTNITSSINTAGYGVCNSNVMATTAGKLYRVSFSMALNSGTMPSYYLTSAIDLGGAIISYAPCVGGANSIVFKATTATTCFQFQIGNGVASNYSVSSVTLYEVTPGCVAADSKGPDGWQKNSGLRIYREYSGPHTQVGSFYALKVISPDIGGYAIYRNLDVRQCAGRTVTLGKWVKSSVAGSESLQLYDNVSGTTSSASHSGSGNYEWLEVTKTFSASATIMIAQLYNAKASTFYVACPMLVFGPSIGQGNYSPMANETVWLETPVPSLALDAKSGLSSTGPNGVDVEVDTSGRLGKGVKATDQRTNIGDSASSSNTVYMIFRRDSVQEAQYYADVMGLFNSSGRNFSNWLALSPTGTYEYQLVASGAGTFTCYAHKYLGVQL